MKEKIYLVSRVTISKEIPIEYVVIRRKRDMRYKFCKNHDKDIIDYDLLIKLISKHNMQIEASKYCYSLKNNNLVLGKIIAPNGKTAYEFYRDLKNK